MRTSNLLNVDIAMSEKMRQNIQRYNAVDVYLDDKRCYLLVQLLEEAQVVTVEAQLVSEGTLLRYQRSTNRRIQGRPSTAWEE